MIQPVTDGGRVFVLDGYPDLVVRAFEATTGAELWTHPAATVLLAACSPARRPAPAQQPAQLPTPMVMADTPAATESAARIDPFVFQQAVRKLWEDHITWTRVFIISEVAGLPEADTAAGRLLQNQVDIGNAIKPFYGDPAGNQLTSLLKDHILTAADLLAAAKSGDQAKFEAANTHWYDNANQIASFLNTANPKNWQLSDMQAMMKSHLDLTLEEATARLKEDWAGDVAAYDKVHNEILGMADMLANGIIQQFPDQFASQQVSQQKIGLTLAMNKLWEDHVTWTRIYIISATSGLADADAAAQRLLQNQVDIGNAIKPLYGEQAGAQLSSLLKDHILIAASIVAAAKAEECRGAGQPASSCNRLMRKKQKSRTVTPSGTSLLVRVGCGGPMGPKTKTAKMLFSLRFSGGHRSHPAGSWASRCRAAESQWEAER